LRSGGAACTSDTHPEPTPEHPTTFRHGPIGLACAGPPGTPFMHGPVIVVVVIIIVVAASRPETIQHSSRDRRVRCTQYIDRTLDRFAPGFFRGHHHQGRVHLP